jgi:hypothetical protein
MKMDEHGTFYLNLLSIEQQRPFTLKKQVTPVDTCRKYCCSGAFAPAQSLHGAKIFAQPLPRSRRTLMT